MTADAAELELGLEAVDVQPEPDDLTLWSVTTIIGVLDKPALLFWAAGMTADAAIDEGTVWKAMLKGRGRDEAWKWLRDARNRAPKSKLSSAKLGTVAHWCFERYALTGVRPTKDEVADQVRSAGSQQVDVEAETNVVGRMLVQFDGWLQRFSPSYQATEVCVYSPTYGYAGQADGFLTIDGVRFLSDYKTSREPLDSSGDPRKPYPEQVGLQIAAYRFAEFAAVWRPRRELTKFSQRYYYLSEAERAIAVPVPEVDMGLCIHVTPERCEAFPINADADAHYSFLAAVELFGWVNERSKKVMGVPLEAEQ